MAKKLSNMTNEELVDQMEETVRAWHYDPFGDYERDGHYNYKTDDLKEEILKRFKQERK